MQGLPLEMQHAILVLLPSDALMFARMTCSEWRALMPPTKTSIHQVVKHGRRAMMEYLVMNPEQATTDQHICNIYRSICAVGHISMLKWFHDHPDMCRVIQDSWLVRAGTHPPTCVVHASAHYAASVGRAQILQLIGNHYPQIYTRCADAEQCDLDPRMLVHAAIRSNDSQTVMVILGTHCTETYTVDKMIAFAKQYEKWVVYEMLVEYANGL